MKSSQKFTFDRSFDAKPKKQEPALAFTAEDLQAAREAAFLEGQTVGRQQALQGIEQATCEAVTNLGARIAELMAREAARQELMQAEAAALAVAITRTLAPRLMAAEPAGEISHMVARYFEICRDAPQLVIRVAPELVEELDGRLKNLAAEQAFGGEIVLRGDPALRNSDCTVEWGDGGAERRERVIQEEIDRLVEDFIAARERAAAELCA